MTHIDIDQPIPNCPNISWREMVRTANEPFMELNALVPMEFYDDGVAIAQLVQAVRSHFNRPASIHSGWRCKELNAATRGASSTSQHMLFQAVDFHIVGKPLEDVFNWIWKESHIPFGQLLLEGTQAGKPSWIHLSLGPPWYRPTPGRQVGVKLGPGKFNWLA